MILLGRKGDPHLIDCLLPPSLEKHSRLNHTYLEMNDGINRKRKILTTDEVLQRKTVPTSRVEKERKRKRNKRSYERETETETETETERVGGVGERWRGGER